MTRPEAERGRIKSPEVAGEALLAARLTEGLDDSETGKVLKAYEWIRQLYGDRLRKDKETPVWRHSYEVVMILKEEFGLNDYNYRVAGLLHDVEEDCGISRAEIEAEFGAEVAMWVEGVSNFKRSDGEDDDVQTRVKLVNGSYVSPPVAVIKLADRLHNMRTLASLSREKQLEKAVETRDIYVQLAEAYGLWNVKVELEDLAFSYLMPERYSNRLLEMQNDPRTDVRFRAYVESRVRSILTGVIAFEVEARDKGVWRTESKAVNSGIEAVNDLFKVRVTVDEDRQRGLTAEQVRALAVDEIQSHFGSEVEYSLEDDYIYGNRRPNGYSAVQLTVMVNGQMVEIAVATKADEEFNKWGIVALLRGGRDWREQMLAPVVVVKRNNGDMEVQTRAVYVDPQATYLDVAYRANTDKAAYLKGVTVNGKRAEMTRVVEAGAMAEFIYDLDEKAVSEEWKPYCLPETVRMIEQQLDDRDIETVVWCGRDVLNRLLQDRGVMDIGDLDERHLRAFVAGFGEAGDILINPRLRLGGIDYVCWAIGKRIFEEDKIVDILDKSKITKKELELTTVWVEGREDKPGIMRKLVDVIGLAAADRLITKVYTRAGGGYGIRVVIKGMTAGEERQLQRLLTGKDERGFSEGFFDNLKLFTGRTEEEDTNQAPGSESYLG